MKIKILHPYGQPFRATAGSAGFDVRTCIDKCMVVLPGETILVPLGFSLELDAGYGAFLLPRSGLGHKHGIVLGNLVGLIDEDYKGQAFASVWNRNDAHGDAFTINPGDRIAQMVVMPVWTGEFSEVEELTDTARGANGFGSTGQ